VELSGHQVVLGVDAAEGDSVLRCTADAGRVFRRRVVAVHEVEVAVLGDAGQHRVFIVEPDAVPSHVGNLQSWRQQLGVAGHHAKTGCVTLFGPVHEQLEAQADAQEGPS